MRNLFLTGLIITTGCTTVSKPVPDIKIPEEHDDIAYCTTVYDPHLCMIKVDEETFSAYGTNLCVAKRRLQKTLKTARHNVLLANIAKCGRVFTSYEGPLLIKKSCNVLFDFNSN